MIVYASRLKLVQESEGRRELGTVLGRRVIHSVNPSGWSMAVRKTTYCAPSSFPYARIASLH